MQCSEFEVRLCDYLDGALDQAARQAVEEHAATCRQCATLLADSQAANRFLKRVEAIEAPPELVTNILYRTPRGPWGLRLAGAAGGQHGWRRWLQLLVQPRYAMSMAMTILSFSMLYRVAGVQVKQLEAADLNPAAIWYRVDDQAHRVWNRGMKFYQNARFIYEIVQQWRAFQAEEEQAPEMDRSRQEQTPAGTQPRREPRKVDPGDIKPGQGKPSAAPDAASRPG